MPCLTRESIPDSSFWRRCQRIDADLIVRQQQAAHAPAADHDAHRAPRFVPSVPERVFAVLEEVTTRNLPPTRVFCAWGSGCGTATCLASLLGYEANGLEIEEEPVRLSRAIARRLGIPVEMRCTSLFPEGYDASSGGDGAALVTPESWSGHNNNDEDGGLCATTAWRSPSPTSACFLPIHGQRSKR